MSRYDGRGRRPLDSWLGRLILLCLLLASLGQAAGDILHVQDSALYLYVKSIMQDVG